MIRALITVRPVGLPVEHFSGLFQSTTDAAIFAIEQLGDRPGSISAKAQP